MEMETLKQLMKESIREVIREDRGDEVFISKLRDAIAFSKKII
ncbi:hypothetical protein [Planktothrix sp.]